MTQVWHVLYLHQYLSSVSGRAKDPELNLVVSLERENLVWLGIGRKEKCSSSENCDSLAGGE